MRSTSEVRWFVRGALPAAVVRWFEAAGGRPEWEERTDRYVRTAADDLGVKVRGGDVEAKRRTARLGETHFADGVAAPVERWRKWSFSLAEDAAPDAPDWVAVHKRRLNQPFAVGAEGVRPVASEDEAALGCSLEVSELGVEGATWWSVCLEAWGEDEAALPDALRRAAAHVFGHGTPPPLPAERAMGYPAWLADEA